MRIIEINRKTVERAGEGPYAEYRIPGIAVTDKGTLLLVYEGRMRTNDDWAQIDAVLLRSEDGGKTFAKTILADGNDGNTANNPTLIVDEGLVHVIYHINYARAFVRHSADDGVTWSEPEEITNSFGEFPYEWNVCATGPGHGIRTESGRLIASVWIANGKRIDARRAEHQPSEAGWIYSDDRGKSWHAGRLFEGVENASETNVCVLSDERLLFNIRNTGADFFRRIAYSTDGAENVSKPFACETLPDPICFGSTVVLKNGKLLFCGCHNGPSIRPETPRARVDLSFRVSVDDGRTWEKIYKVDEEGGYSDLAVSGDEVFALYETTDAKTGVITELRLAAYRIAE